MKHTLTLLAAIVTLTACDNSQQTSNPKVIGTLYTSHVPAVDVVDYHYWRNGGGIWVKTEKGAEIYASNYTLILNNEAK